MRRVLVLVLAVGLLVLAGAHPVGAAPRSINRRISGPFAGATHYEFTTAGCSFVHQLHDATYTIAKGTSGSFHLDGCVDIGPTGFEYTGTFTLTTPKGAVLTGTVTGTVLSGEPTSNPCAPNESPGPLDFTLTVTHGTAGFKRASGSIHLVGVWCPQAIGSGGPISGVLAGDVRH